MAFAPPLGGSSLTFAFTVLTHLFVYIKHKGHRVKKFRKDFEDLKLAADTLVARWSDFEVEIEWQLTKQKNQQYTTAKNNVQLILKRYYNIEQRYTELCKYLDSTVASDSNAAAAENQGSQNQTITSAAENQGSQNQTIISAAATESHQSQEAANKDQITTNVQANGSKPPSNIEEQKIWTRKFFKLAELDKHIVKLLPKVVAVREGLKLEDLIRQAKPKKVEIMEAVELDNTVPSHQKHLENLRGLVEQQDCKRIGVCGDPQVGKTNIMKNLNNSFDSSPPFHWDWNVDYVIWVTLRGEHTKEKIIETMQEDIIARLKLEGGKNRSRNSDIISSALSQKKYLMLVDDFSPIINLEDVGIKKEHKDGKVVLVANSFNAQIKAQLDAIQVVESLSSHAQIFFMKFIDDYDKLSTEQKDMIPLILRELGGLPGPIASIARDLNAQRQKPEYWDGIKQRLQSDVGRTEFLGLGGVTEAYRKAYEDLKENDLKKCLLYAALFPNAYKIPRNTLVECWKAENFLNCRLPTLKAARSEGSVIFTQLETSPLLESCCEKYVKMPVFARKVALVLPFPEEGDGALCVRSGPDRDGHLAEKEWNNARMVSMMLSNLEKLPTSPKCKRISTLLLQLNPTLRWIEDDFFLCMRSLRVLDLHGTGIQLLPLSISNLIALRSLYLNSCGGLEQLPITIVELKELEVLDIRHTSIPWLPKQISNLVSLRCLRISFAAEKCNLTGEPKRWFNIFSSNQEVVIFPPTIHEKLSELEELTIDFSREVSAEVVDRIKKEVARFEKRKYFQKIFNYYSGQAPESYLTEENGDERVKSHVAERSTPVNDNEVIPNTSHNHIIHS